MSDGQIKRYRIKDKSGNTKDVIYDPASGLTSQEFLTREIAKFNAEKEIAQMQDVSQNIDEKKQDFLEKTPETEKNVLMEPEKPKTTKPSDAPVTKKKKKERSLASIMASKSGVKLTNIVGKRNTEARKTSKKPKGISISSHVPQDRLVTTGVKKS